MTRSFFSLLAISALTFTLVGCETEIENTTKGPRDVQNALVVGTPAPSLGEVTPIQVSEGLDINLESLKGQVVVIEFWATLPAGHASPQ